MGDFFLQIAGDCRVVASITVDEARTSFGDIFMCSNIHIFENGFI